MFTKNFDRKDGIEGAEFLKAAKKLAADFVQQSGFDFKEYQNDINNLPHDKIIKLCQCMAQVIQENKLIMSSSNRINFFGNQPNFINFLSKLHNQTKDIVEKTKERILNNHNEEKYLIEIPMAVLPHH